MGRIFCLNENFRVDDTAAVVKTQNLVSPAGKLWTDDIGGQISRTMSWNGIGVRRPSNRAAVNYGPGRVNINSFYTYDNPRQGAAGAPGYMRVLRGNNALNTIHYTLNAWLDFGPLQTDWNLPPDPDGFRTQAFTWAPGNIASGATINYTLPNPVTDPNQCVCFLINHATGGNGANEHARSLGHLRLTGPQTVTYTKYGPNTQGLNFAVKVVEFGSNWEVGHAFKSLSGANMTGAWQNVTIYPNYDYTGTPWTQNRSNMWPCENQQSGTQTNVNDSSMVCRWNGTEGLWQVRGGSNASINRHYSQFYLRHPDAVVRQIISSAPANGTVGQDYTHLDMSAAAWWTGPEMLKHLSVFSSWVSAASGAQFMCGQRQCYIDYDTYEIKSSGRTENQGSIVFGIIVVDLANIGEDPFKSGNSYVGETKIDAYLGGVPVDMYVGDVKV